MWMTEKRFIAIDDGFDFIVRDIVTGDDLIDADGVADVLNDYEKENEQLKQLLDYADDLIQSHLSEHFIRQWRNLKTGHKEYNDFWEEKLKKLNELKEDVE